MRCSVPRSSRMRAASSAGVTESSTSAASEREATRGSGMPRTQTKERRPGPRSSTIGSTATTSSERTYFP
jgi:hypothetical protein